MNSIESLQLQFFDFLQKQFLVKPEQLEPVTFSLNTDESKQQFGDISSNAAMILAKQLNTNPRTLAQEIITSFIHPFVTKIDLAGPGFLNFFLKPETFKTLMNELIAQDNDFFKLDKNIVKKKYNVEFVSANPTGPLHLGHGRGGIIGDVLGNILRFIGHSVTKEFYINDAGSQIQKLGESFKARCLQQLDQSATVPEDGYQGEYLVQLAQQAVEEFGKSIANKPDEFFAQYAKEKLLVQIQETLAFYGIHFDVWFSEKSLHTSGAIDASLKHLQEHDATYAQDGALWFKSTQFGDDKDRVLRKANSELTYVAADVAYLENKLNRDFDHLIMVLGQDHHSYVVRLKGILQALGYKPDLLDVILYQLVTLKESGELVRMSKRAGKIVTLHDVIETVGSDVARFFYLNRKADAHLDFDIALALKRTEENPVYYVQYAYVRTLSILQKAAQDGQLLNLKETDTAGMQETEHLLLKKIISLRDLLITISKNYQTHALTYYVLELSQLFHSYYAKNRVIEPDNIPQSRARLLLIRQLRDTFQLCLKLLGISQPEKM